MIRGVIHEISCYHAWSVPIFWNVHKHTFVILYYMHVKCKVFCQDWHGDAAGKKHRWEQHGFPASSFFQGSLLWEGTRDEVQQLSVRLSSWGVVSHRANDAHLWHFWEHTIWPQLRAGPVHYRWECWALSVIFQAPRTLPRYSYVLGCTASQSGNKTTPLKLGRPPLESQGGRATVQLQISPVPE